MSFTIVSLLVGIISTFLTKFNIQYAPEDVTNFVNTLLLIASGIGVWWGRYRHGDITWYGTKKPATPPAA